MKLFPVSELDDAGSKSSEIGRAVVVVVETTANWSRGRRECNGVW